MRMGTNIRQCNEAKMLRYQIFLAYGVAMAAIWYAALQQKAEIADRLGISNGQASVAVDYLPVFLVLTLGVYAVVSVAHRVATMADSPEAAAEIDWQVKEARGALDKMGVRR